MSNKLITREMLSSIRSYDEFFVLCNSLRGENDDILFESLFSLAISARGDGANATAAFVLLELEPKCSMTCEEAIEAISKSKWDVSNREVPFYLISQFGKWKLKEAILAFHERLDVTVEQKKT